MDPTVMENLNCEWSPQDPSKIRRLKVILPQFYAALAILAVNLSQEFFTKFTFIDIIAHESISYTLYWVMCGIGLLIGGIVAQFTGARAIVMLAGTSSAVGWIILESISSVTVLQWTYYIVTFTQKIMQAPAYVYLAEISQPNMRNVLMAVMYLSSDIRSIYFYLAGLEYTKITAILQIVFAVFGLIVMFFLPESPYWLANKGRYHVVESSLAWFRGRTTPENVKCESKAIISNAQNSPTAFKLFFKQSLYLPIVVVCSVFLASAFIRIFYQTLLKYLSSVSEAPKFKNLLLLWGISTIIISISFLVLISVIGKRVMILISLFGGSMVLLIAFIAGYLRENQILSTDAYWYLFLICQAVAHLSLMIAVIQIPLLLNGELFPSRLRNLGAGFGLFFAYVVQAVSDSLYAMYFDSVHGALLALAFTSIFGLVLLLWLFPRNENKSLVEIEHSSKDLLKMQIRKK